ncbi:MAG: ribonuclease HII [Lachnospiraceae bacterium]|nr:ribonuclease HII [Lachnospiraceae bacterium]
MNEEKLKAERERLEAMRFFEHKYASEAQYIAGMDEVGRGPLAGPVVAACVILPPDVELLYLNDSKKVTEKRREVLYDQIMECAVAVSIGMNDAARIDEINILEATKEAMKKAVAGMPVTPDLLLIDAVHLDDIDIRQVSITKGDAKSVSIAAASIIAKVTRDRMMTELDSKYPGYFFAKNKGYGTKQHYAGLRDLGPCDIHRRTFIKTVDTAWQ